MRKLAAPDDLRCEYLVDPIGLDEPRPRLSWKSPFSNSSTQGAYQILVSSAIQGAGELWDSGRVRSSESHLVEYEGKKLEPIQRAWWRVRIWGASKSPTPWSKSAFWEAGLSLPNHWTGAMWISSTRSTPTKSQAVYLRREFSLGRTRIHRARLFLSAKGLYIAFLNGVRVGAGELTPGWTDYNRRIVYDAHDVTSLVKPGSNRLEIVLGDGWYCGNVCWFGRGQYGSVPQALAKLYIEPADSEPIRIVSDENWLASDGPVRANDLLMGESVDFRAASSRWTPVEATSIGQVPMVCRRNESIRAIETLEPVSIQSSGKNKWLIDLGQNMVGRLRVNAKGRAGTKVTIRHAEILDQSGRLYLDNLRSAKQVDAFVLRRSSESFEPTFTFHGFRFAELAGITSKPKVEGIVLSSLTKRTGYFRCGHELVNKLAENIRWGMLGNYLEVPTDCPQRDERLGWMGDAQIFAPTAVYNYDIAPFMTKWLQDVRDAQSEEGAFPNVAPQMTQLGDGAPAWADAGVIVPWTMYRFYGDKRILEQSWHSMMRYVEMIAEANPDFIWRNRVSHNFGDWLNVDAETPKEVLATAYFAHSTSLLAKTAEVLARYNDAERFANLANSIKQGFRKAFVSNSCVVYGETQTGYVLALRFRLLTQVQEEKAAKRLVGDLEKLGHLTTGFLGVGHLLPVLTQIGRDDLAIRLLLREEYPSWGYSIRHGATTIWERWDGWTEDKGFQDPGMNSFNHYALGSCGEWLFSRLAGIQLDDSDPGLKRFVLDPLPSQEIGSVDASYESPYGKIESHWKIKGGKFRWRYSIPPNTQVRVHVPKKKPVRQGPGEYEVEVNL